MNTNQISVPHGDCILSVSHNKRTVSLIRSGKRGEISKQKHTVLNGDWDSSINPLNKNGEHTGFIKGYQQSPNSRIETSNKPDLERGWLAVTQTLVTTTRINTNNLIAKPSINGVKELQNVPLILLNIVGNIHDLAYEIARNNGSHCISWTLQNVSTGAKLIATSEWNNGKFTFKLENQ